MKTAIDGVVFDPTIYPRDKWSTSTIERYADALEAGSEFPPVVLEEGTSRLLDGKHRLEAHKKLGLSEIDAEWRIVPAGMSARYFAATLSTQHGDRLGNGDIKRIAVAPSLAIPRPAIVVREYLQAVVFRSRQGVSIPDHGEGLTDQVSNGDLGFQAFNVYVPILFPVSPKFVPGFFGTGNTFYHL